MRWSYIICLLLVNAAFAKPRPKRSLGYFKSFISNKLFGSKTITIVQPILAKNEPYQLFKIPGYDDIIIKVTRINETEKKKPDKEDPVIVKPEVAIIGSYLGTKTERETLLALEVTKRLLESGILSEKRQSFVQEYIPMMPQNYVPVIPETIVPLPPPLYVEEPNKSKYYYKQEGEKADMTYESYNNGDVIVTRTEKEPPLPQYIKMRLADVATMGANPFIRQYENLQANRYPIPVPQYVNPSVMTGHVYGNFEHGGMTNTVAQDYVSHSNRGSIVVNENGMLSQTPYSVHPYQLENMRRVIICRENLGKMCPHENNLKSDKIESQQVQNPVVNMNVNTSENNVKKITVNEFLKNHSGNEQYESKYSYKQMNHHSNDNFSEVKVGESPKLSNEAMDAGINLNKDFVFIPPKDDSELPTLLKLHDKEVNQNTDRKQDDKNAYTSKVITNERNNFVSIQSSYHNMKMDGNSFKEHPIVVNEQPNIAIKDGVNAKTNEFENKENNADERRGDIPNNTY